MGQVALPDCPEHPGSSVVKAGFYGSGQHRRQRYWCRPRGEQRHRFTPTLPRLTTDEHSCRECERDVAPHEGPPTVRKHGFAVRDAASALSSVASGNTYKAASVHVRHAVGRRGRVPNGQLVADWVEQLTEPLWQGHGPGAWPRVVVCDETTFSARTIEGTAHQQWPTDLDAVEALPRHVVFTVCAVTGHDPGMAHPRPWFAWAVAGRARKADWEEVFAQLPGRPEVVLSDLNPSVFNAAEAYWPADPTTGLVAPRRAYCTHHRLNNFPWTKAWRRAVDTTTDPRHDDAVELKKLLKGCTKNADAWDLMCRRVVALRGSQAQRWLNHMNTEYVIWEQLDRRLDGEPRSNSSVEAFVRTIRGVFRGRPFRNKVRTNQLLKLVTLDSRGAAGDPAGWSQTLREALEEQGGRPAVNQRDCCDPAGSPSLHF